MERMRIGLAEAADSRPGTLGVGLSAASAALGVVLLVAGASLQGAFSPEVIGALTLFLWPAWLFGAILIVLGVAAFGVAVVSLAATVGVALVRR